MQINDIVLCNMGSHHFISAMGVFKYLRIKSIALQLNLDLLKIHLFPSFPSADKLHTDRRMEGTQEATSKSGRPFGEYIIIGGFSLTV